MSENTPSDGSWAKPGADTFEDCVNNQLTHSELSELRNSIDPRQWLAANILYLTRRIEGARAEQKDDMHLYITDMETTVAFLKSVLLIADAAEKEKKRAENFRDFLIQSGYLTEVQWKTIANSSFQRGFSYAQADANLKSATVAYRGVFDMCLPETSNTRKNERNDRENLKADYRNSVTTLLKSALFISTDLRTQARDILREKRDKLTPEKNRELVLRTSEFQIESFREALFLKTRLIEASASGLTPDDQRVNPADAQQEGAEVIDELIGEQAGEFSQEHADEYFPPERFFGLLGNQVSEQTKENKALLFQNLHTDSKELGDYLGSLQARIEQGVIGKVIAELDRLFKNSEAKIQSGIRETTAAALKPLIAGIPGEKELSGMIVDFIMADPETNILSIAKSFENFDRTAISDFAVFMESFPTELQTAAENGDIAKAKELSDQLFSHRGRLVSEYSELVSHLTNRQIETVENSAEWQKLSLKFTAITIGSAVILYWGTRSLVRFPKKLLLPLAKIPETEKFLQQIINKNPQNAKSIWAFSERLLSIAGKAITAAVLYEIANADNPLKAAAKIAIVLTSLGVAAAVSAQIAAIAACLVAAVFATPFGDDILEMAGEVFDVIAERTGMAKEYYEGAQSLNIILRWMGLDYFWDKTIGELYKGDNAMTYFSNTFASFGGEYLHAGRNDIVGWNKEIRDKIEEQQSLLQKTAMKRKTVPSEDQRQIDLELQEQGIKSHIAYLETQLIEEGLPWWDTQKNTLQTLFDKLSKPKEKFRELENLRDRTTLKLYISTYKNMKIWEQMIENPSERSEYEKVSGIID